MKGDRLPELEGKLIGDPGAACMVRLSGVENERVRVSDDCDRRVAAHRHWCEQRILRLDDSAHANLLAQRRLRQALP